MYLYLLQHIILGAGQQLWLAHAQAQKFHKSLWDPFGILPLGTSAKQAVQRVLLQIEGWGSQHFGWLADGQNMYMTPSHWFPPLDTSAQQVTVWRKPSPGLLYQYVCNPIGLALLDLFVEVRSDLRFKCVSLYINLKLHNCSSLVLLAFVNSHLTSSAILRNHRFAFIYTLCMHLSLIMLCLLGFKPAHN